MKKLDQGVRVEIYDQSYDIRGKLDPVYLETLARFVDGKMKSITDKGEVVDSLRVAVLAALNIADDYFQLKAEHETQTTRVNRKANQINDALDKMLKAALVTDAEYLAEMARAGYAQKWADKFLKLAMEA